MELLKNVSIEKLSDMIANNAAAIDRMQASTAAAFDRMQASTAATIDRLSAKVDETTANVNKLTADINSVNKKYGNIGNRLGKVMELVVVPGIRPVLSDAGRNFDEVIPNMAIYKSRGDRLVEVDVFLDNGKEAMAVEIKTRLTIDEVNEHLEQLKKLRKFEELIEIEGKTLYGGIAGIKIDPDARKYALDKGIYIIEILEDKSRLKAIAPPAEKIATW